MSGAQFTPKELAWLEERVRWYIRKSFTVVVALERARADFRALKG